MVRWGGTVGNVNYFTTQGDLPIPNVRYGFGMGNKTIRGGECPGGQGPDGKGSWPCSNTAGWTRSR